MKPTIETTHNREHCHVCGDLRWCTVVWTHVPGGPTFKFAACHRCRSKGWSVEELWAP